MALPRAGDGECRLTWVGHCTALVQVPGLNVLTDPIWSRRASPVPWFGPKRLVRAVPELDHLPPIDVVLLSHDHYDHLDRRTVRALARRNGDRLTWLTPLGYSGWLARQGITRVVELDWWDGHELSGGRYRAVALPSRHWTRRTPTGTNRRLWCSWALLSGAASSTSDSGPPPLPVYFAGDTGYCRVFREIGAELGPFALSLVPIGAYEPEWFMGAAHLNPEEAVQVYGDLGGRGRLVATHWGHLSPDLRRSHGAAAEGAGRLGEGRTARRAPLCSEPRGDAEARAVSGLTSVRARLIARVPAALERVAYGVEELLKAPGLV